MFVRQLAQRVRTADLGQFCEAAGPVRDVRLVYDRVSNRSKGVAYVEFVEEASVPKAISLTGQKLCGIPVIIELTETEKNRLAEEAAAEAARKQSNSGVTGYTSFSYTGHGPAPTVNFNKVTKVFVGGLHPSLDEEALRKVFEPFGDISHVERDSSSATVHYRNASDAAMAVDQMNGFLLAGRAIRVGILRDRPDGTNAVQYKAGDVFTANLDDSETQGLTLNAKSRTELMMKLARDPIALPYAGGPSPCLLISGMYDPDEEAEVGWEYGISDEVRAECSKFGAVQHLSVAKNKAGEVWVKFSVQQAAVSAMAALNGRWFGGRQLKVSYVDPAVYRTKFKQ